MVVNSILVALGGFFGAITRYGISMWMKKKKYTTQFPYATYLVNVSGSFLLGLLSTSGLSQSAILFAGTGFLGSYTTFSTFKWESLQLWEKQQEKAFLYLGLHYTIGIICAGIGMFLGTFLLSFDLL